MATTQASDTVNNKDYQLVKLVHGKVGVIDGRVSSENPLPIFESSITTSPQSSNDSFGRQRVSNPFTLFDSKLTHDKSPLFWDEQLVGDAISIHSSGNAGVNMSVSASGDSVIRQTFMRFNYQSGKSQQVMMTGTLGSGVPNLIRRIGYFDDNNGLYDELDGTILSAVIRKDGVNTKVAQSNWSVDTLDGSGVSEKILDTSKKQLTMKDFEWLGVGSVRSAYIVDGLIRFSHIVHNANIQSLVYMSTPNLPLRYEIISHGGSGSLMHNCSTVISEGGRQDNGILRYKSTEGTHLDANAANEIYAVIGIRLKSSFLDTSINLVGASMTNATNDDYEWMVILNPSVSGSFVYSGETNSAVQTAIGVTDNILSGGTIIDGGMIKSGGNTGDIKVGLENALRLGSSIGGTMDEMILCVRPLSINADIDASLTWRELL